MEAPHNIYPADIMRMEKNQDGHKEKSTKKKKNPLSLGRLTFHQSKTDSNSGIFKHRSKSSDMRPSAAPETEAPDRPGYMNPTMSSQNQRRRNYSGVNTPMGMGGLSNNHMTPAELENRLRTSRMECEQLKVKLGVTAVECDKLSNQVRQVSELKETCQRLQSEMSVVKRRQKADDEYLQRIEELEQENMILKQHMTNMNSKLLEMSEALTDRESLTDRLNHLEEDYHTVTSSQDRQRQQYERFVDHIVSQVVQSSLQQKSMNELCLRLQTRLQFVESQNQCLAQIIRNQMVNANSPHSISSSNSIHKRMESLCINSGTYTKSIKQGKQDLNELQPNAEERNASISQVSTESPFRPVALDESHSSQSLSASAPHDMVWSDSLEQMPSSNPALSLGCATPEYYQIDFTTSDSNPRIANNNHQHRKDNSSHCSNNLTFRLHADPCHSMKAAASNTEEGTLRSVMRNDLSNSSSKEQQLTTSDHSSSNLKTTTSSSQDDSCSRSQKLPTSFDSNAEEVTTITKQVIHSTSFTKDDGYSSMPCDNAIASPLASRRELSTVGEQRGLEEEHHKEYLYLNNVIKSTNTQSKTKSNTLSKDDQNAMKNSFQSDVSTISYVSSSSLEPEKVFAQEAARNEILEALKTLNPKCGPFRDQKYRYLTCSRKNERFNRCYKRGVDLEVYSMQQYLTVHQRHYTLTTATDVYSDSELLTERFIITSSTNSQSRLADSDEGGEEADSSSLGLSNVDDLEVVFDTTARSRFSNGNHSGSSKKAMPQEKLLFSHSTEFEETFHEECLDYFEHFSTAMALQLSPDNSYAIPVQSNMQSVHICNNNILDSQGNQAPFSHPKVQSQPTPVRTDNCVGPSNQISDCDYPMPNRNIPVNYDNVNPSFIAISSSSESERPGKYSSNSKVRSRKSLPCPKSISIRPSSPVPTGKLTNTTRSSSHISTQKSSSRPKATRPTSQIIRPTTNHSFSPPLPPLSAPPIPPRTTSRLGDAPAYAKRMSPAPCKEIDKSPSKSLLVNAPPGHSSKIPRSTKTPPREPLKCTKTSKQMHDTKQKASSNKTQGNTNRSRPNSRRSQNIEFDSNRSNSLTKSIAETEYDPVPEETAIMQYPELLDLMSDGETRALPTSTVTSGVTSFGVSFIPPPPSQFNQFNPKVSQKSTAFTSNSKTGIPRYCKTPVIQTKYSNGPHPQISAIDHLTSTVSEIEASLNREPLFYKNKNTPRIPNGHYSDNGPPHIHPNYRPENPTSRQLHEKARDSDSDSSKSHSSQDLYIDDEIEEQQGIMGPHEFSDSMVGSMDEEDEEDLEDEARLHQLVNGDEARRFIEKLQRFQPSPTKSKRFTDL